MMIWMSMSLTTELHWWGPWWWSGCLCPWSITCIDEVPDDDLYVLDYWPTVLHWWGPWWWSRCLCPWSLTWIDEVSDDDLVVYVPDHWPALISSLMMIWMTVWSLTRIDEVPDDVLDVYVPDHWPALMRSLMMIWMSMSLITDLHWWGPWWWSGCLCPWSLTCIDEVSDDDLDVPDHWPLSCIDEVPDDDLDVYVPDHWPALMRTLMMIWMSMSLITDLHWWAPWWWSGCLCPWSLSCIDEDPDDDLDVYVPDHWPVLMRSLMMIWMSMSLITVPALMRTLMMIWMSMSPITDLHWWGPWWWSGCLCPWSLTWIDEDPDDDLNVYVPENRISGTVPVLFLVSEQPVRDALRIRRVADFLKMSNFSINHCETITIYIQKVDLNWEIMLLL